MTRQRHIFLVRDSASTNRGNPFGAPRQALHAAAHHASIVLRLPGPGMSKTSLDKSKIKFLLLEGIHPSAIGVLEAAGYSNIEVLAGALPDAELKARIADV